MVYNLKYTIKKIRMYLKVIEAIIRFTNKILTNISDTVVTSNY